MGTTGQRRSVTRRGGAGHRARSASSPALVLVLALVLLLGACSSDRGGGGAATTSAPAGVTTTTRPYPGERDRQCAAAAALLFRDVAARAEDLDPARADQAATDGLVPEQITAFLRDLGQEAEGDAADDVQAVIVGTEAFATSGQLYGDAVRAAFDRTVVRAAATCPPSVPVWGCIAPTSTITATTDGPRRPTAEAALQEQPGEPVGERIAVLEDPTVVAYAWVDEDRLVRERVTVVRDERGWLQRKRTTCPPPM